MVNCSVSTCDNSTESRPDLSFHRFPTGKFQRVWLKALNLGGWRPRDSSRICLHHFNRDDLRICDERVRLVIGAVPKLNPKQIYKSSPLSRNGKNAASLIEKKRKNRRDPSSAAPVTLRKLEKRRKKNETSKIYKSSLLSPNAKSPAKLIKEEIDESPPLSPHPVSPFSEWSPKKLKNKEKVRKSMKTNQTE